jgi:hypothetical protein
LRAARDARTMEAMSRWSVLLLLPLLMLGACGGGDEPAAPATPEPSTTAPEQPDPTLPGKPSGSSQTLTGTVSSGVEDNCVLLTTTTGQRGTWLLVGPVGDLADGDRVTVRGSPAPDLATRCQQGTPFVVEAVEPG